MRKKKNAVVGGAASVFPPFLPTLHHISARKTASVTGKNLKLTQVVVLIVEFSMGRASPTNLTGPAGSGQVRVM